MAHSSWGSGWPNCQGSKINSGFIVSGTKFPGGMRNELVDLTAMLVQECKNRGYRFGNSGDPSYGCWGYSCRAISGSNSPSNHSWGLAVDINAPSNPYTSPLVTDMPSWMPDLWNEYGFRWGGDYSGSKDAMHYEFMESVSAAASYTQKARDRGLGGGASGGGGGGTPPTPPATYTPGVFPLPSGYYYGPKDGPTESISGMAGEDQAWIEGLKDAQRHLQQHIPGSLPVYGADGMYGETASGETHDATLQFQQMKGIEADALIGPTTFGKLMEAPSGGTPPTPPTGPTGQPAPPFPLPQYYYYGPKNGPTESISGMAGEQQSWINGLVQAQQRLMHWTPGCLPQYGADGMYGETLSGETHDATLNFQRSRGLEADALIGPSTWGKLWTG
jgi:peptidoglycan hydrolase-like protein with peptidoglycan-binding domain